MATVPEYAQLANRVYARTQQNRTPVPTGWIELQWIPDRALTGFCAGAYRNGNAIVISYTGTNDGKIGDTVIANAPAATGLVPSPQVWEAMQMYLEVVRDNPGANITFTGHSLGGGLAAMMAVFFDRPAVVFDAAPFELGARAISSLDIYRAQMAAYGFSNAAFQAYVSAPDVLFAAREANATGYWLEGEFLNTLRFETTSIGTYNKVPAGDQTAAAVALHSMTALASMLTSTAFAAAVRKTPVLLKIVLDGGPYYRDPAASTEPNFIDRLYVAQTGNSATPLLDRFGADIGKLVASPDGMAAQSETQKGLIAAAMEYYYFNDPANATSFLTSSGNGIHFKYGDISVPQIGLKSPRLLAGAIEPFLTTEEWSVVGHALATQDAWHIQTGAGGMNWTANTAAYDAAIGGAQTDNLDGGVGDDILVGGAGADFLTGGTGRDTLIGGVDLDWLDGGTGNDSLIGGQGTDIYHFATGWGSDTISDSDGKGVADSQSKCNTPGRKVGRGDTWRPLHRPGQRLHT